MNIKEIVNKYKDSDSTGKLGIISDLITIFATIVAIITSQIFTIKFVFDELTIIRIAFYMVALGITLLIIFIYIEFISYVKKEFPSRLFNCSINLIIGGIIVLLMYTVWAFVFTIE